MIEELIKLAKEMDAATKRGIDLGLNDDEIAFYDALAANESAVQAMGNDKLKVIAAELVTQGTAKRDHRLDPPGKRTCEDQGHGKAHPQKTWLPAGSSGGSG